MSLMSSGRRQRSPNWDRNLDKLHALIAYAVNSLPTKRNAVKYVAGTLGLFLLAYVGLVLLRAFGVSSGQSVGHIAFLDWPLKFIFKH